MDTYNKLDLVVGMISELKPSQWFTDRETVLQKKLIELAMLLADKCLEEANPKTTSRQPTHSR